MERCGIFPGVNPLQTIPNPLSHPVLCHSTLCRGAFESDDNRTVNIKRFLCIHYQRSRHVGMVAFGRCYHPHPVDGSTIVCTHTFSPSYDHRHILGGGCRRPCAPCRSRIREYRRPCGTSRVRVSHLPGLRGNDAASVTVAAEVRGDGWRGGVCDFDAPCRRDDDTHASTSSIAGADRVGGGVHCFSSIMSFNTRSRG